MGYFEMLAKLAQKENYNKRRRTLVLLVLTAVGMCLMYVVWIVFVSISSVSYDLKVADKYWLYKLDPGAITLLHGDPSLASEAVIGDNITLIGITDKYVVGQVVAPIDSGYVAEVPGFFVVDRLATVKHVGMSEDELRSWLKEHDADWPDLIHPDKWRRKRLIGF